MEEGTLDYEMVAIQPRFSSVLTTPNSDSSQLTTSSVSTSLIKTSQAFDIHQPDDKSTIEILPTNHTQSRVNFSSTPYLSLEELTQNPPEGSIRCPSPYMIPIYDRVAPEQRHDNDRKIPRQIHVSFNQRCVPDELAYGLLKWQKALPDYSFYFHDDEAVERMLQQAYWDTEFPDLHRVMQCVKYKGAMKIDIWRILIVYLFGGLYTDVDVTPASWFNASTIHPNDTFFALSDAYDRPSQWLFAMAPRHPIAQFTMNEIQRRLLKMKNIAKPRVVQITGPQALKAGRKKFEILKEQGLHGYDAMDTTKISKGDTPRYIVSRMNEIVQWEGVSMTVRNKTEQLSGIVHWPDQVKQNKSSSISYEGMSCWDYLAMMDEIANQTKTAPKK